ncbi:MAG: gamma-glutamyl-gamma-aminobutyrate hydrolase family protein [Deltaproteobacteria bacterium]|jgi:GMP synthase (glutamine-hydrolysing)|nr:gamma-glutamyl-gamma-aminobutyrate hydrolase family protein [Deltaproteobacteria bacterium]
MPKKPGNGDAKALSQTASAVVGPKPLLILDCGSITLIKAGKTLAFGDMFMEAAPFSREEAVVVDVVSRPPKIDLTKLQYQGIIITGSLAMLTDPDPWSIKLIPFLEQALDMRVPILGVCYGHHLLASLSHGAVDWHPEGMELGSHLITLAPGTQKTYPLLACLPDAFPAYQAHSQSVVRLPSMAKVLASSKHDPTQIVAYGKRVFSCQFHPEFTAPFMADLLEDLEVHVPTPDLPAKIALGREPMETNHGQKLLRGFLKFCQWFTPANPRYLRKPYLPKSLRTLY